jgi:hypothetical protein
LSRCISVSRVIAAAALAAVAFVAAGCTVDRRSSANGAPTQSVSSKGAETRAILTFFLGASQFRIYDPPSHAPTVVAQHDASLDFSGATYLDGRGNLFEGTLVSGRYIEVYSPPYVNSPKLIPLVDGVGADVFAEPPGGPLLAIGTGGGLNFKNSILQYAWPYDGHAPRVTPIVANLTGKAAVVDQHRDLLLVACCTGSDFGQVLLVYPPPYRKLGRTIRLPGPVLGLFKGNGDAILVCTLAKSGDQINVMRFAWPYDGPPQVGAPFGKHIGMLAMNSRHTLYALAGNSLAWSDPDYTTTAGSVEMDLSGSKFVQQIAFDRNDDLFVVKSFGVHQVGQQQRFELAEFAPPYRENTWTTGVRPDPENEPPGVLYLSP